MPNDNAAVVPHRRLDRSLDRLALRPAAFQRDAARLAARLDARRLDLEITDPASWHAAEPRRRVAVETQFSTEVGGLLCLPRAEELRLARRIEFARIRLEGILAQPAPRPDEPRRRQELQALRLEMVERNLYLVLIGVRRYRSVGADGGDLIQAAAASLLRAVDGFDWRRGVLFRTYAIHWLNQGFRSHLYDSNRTVRVPGYVLKSIKPVRSALERLGDPHASLEEIARESGLSTDTIAAALRVERRICSLDAPLEGRGDTRTLAGELALPDEPSGTESATDPAAIESGVAAALARLERRERRVVELRFGIRCARAHRHSEIGAVLGVSPERVRQILVRALSRMRGARMRRMLEPLIG